MNDYSTKMGRWMVWAGWLIFLVFLTLFFNKYIEKQMNPNQDVTLNAHMQPDNAVILVRNRAGHYVANGLINDMPVVFLVDTGATDVSIPLAVAQKLGLKKGRRIRYQTANGGVTGYRTQLDQIQLGNITLKNIIGGINPGMHDQHILLGMTFLKKLEFTQRGNQLILKNVKFN